MFFARGPRKVVSLTIEHGVIKVLICSGRKVLDYRVLLANPRFFREGQVSNTSRVAGLLRNVLKEMQGDFQRAVAAVPGFQNTLRLLELPRASGLDPKVVIPQEASRTMRISMETYHLDWHQLSDRLGRTRWLTLAASRRSMASLLDTAQRAGVRVTNLELRPFALARAVNQPEAVIAWSAPDGCDVVILKDSVPVEHQSLFWGAELVEDSVFIDRLTEIVGRTIAAYDAASPEPLSEEAPLYVCGFPLSLGSNIGPQVADNLQRTVGELAPPLSYPADLPVHDLIVNMGLVLQYA